MRRIAVVCAMIVGLTAMGPVSTAVADEGPSVTERVEALSAEGAELFNDGDYQGAIEKFQAAYELQPVPNLLYNIGHTYEQIEDWDRATDYYDRFVRSPDVDSEARELALDRIQAIREIQEVEQQQEVAEEPEAPPEPVDDADGPDLLPGYAAVGAGVAMLGAGMVTGLAASGNAAQIDDASLSYDERHDAQSRARTQGFVADGFYVAGVAATAIGGYLLFGALNADTTGDTAHRHTFTPWIGRDNAGLGLHFDF